MSHGEYEGDDPDGDEDVVVRDSAEDVSFAVNLAGVELVKERHQHKRCEHHRVVDVRLRNAIVVVGVIEVKHRRSFVRTPAHMHVNRA